MSAKRAPRQAHSLSLHSSIATRQPTLYHRRFSRLPAVSTITTPLASCLRPHKPCALQQLAAAPGTKATLAGVDLEGGWAVHCSTT